MQDFLKDRPVFTPQEGQIVSATPLPAAGSSSTSFARIVRDAHEAPRPPVAGARAGPAGPGGPAADAAAHTSKVQPVIENGRVTRLVVTCSCGKVTEISCNY